jgi:hypothetical protein
MLIYSCAVKYNGSGRRPAGPPHGNRSRGTAMSTWQLDTAHTVVSFTG